MSIENNNVENANDMNYMRMSDKIEVRDNGSGFNYTTANGVLCFIPNKNPIEALKQLTHLGTVLSEEAIMSIALGNKAAAISAIMSSGNPAKVIPMICEVVFAVRVDGPKLDTNNVQSVFKDMYTVIEVFQVAIEATYLDFFVQGLREVNYQS